MLKLAQELDTDNRVNCFIAGWIAMDPETGAHLRRSAGRRMAGRPARYILSIPGTDARVFTAHSDQEALDKANKGR